MLDVVVVGGGPGGLFAAELLAKRGARVAVFEEHEDIGSPVHCTGVLAADAIKALHLPPEAVLNPLSTVRFVAPGGHAFAYTTSSVEAIVIDRQVFDQGLFRAAERAGVTITRNTRIVRMERNSDGVTMTTGTGETIQARAVVLACGAHYAFQKSLGLGFPAAFLQSAQMEMPASQLGDVEVHFGSHIAPKGFAWVVPVKRPEGSFARVGVMAESDVAMLFERMFERVGDRWQIERPEGSLPRRRMLPLSAIDCTYADRTLVVGDAAGLVKPTTGGGIYYSIVSGQIAADVLTLSLESGDLGASALKRYEDEWRARFEPEFTAQLALRRMAERLSDSEIDALFDLARTDGVLPIVRRTARFNEHRGLVIALLKHAPVRQILMGRLASAVH
ncbi:MAG TPA: NAD(P)/FAD-dependent oxidoreductase [Vicinamibacterales bacterium]|nr:NAD(P)/FAD-dependent oxidoreductase [Vicinamibacterales bacterium]